jgi:hypothetical protein
MYRSRNLVHLLPAHPLIIFELFLDKRERKKSGKTRKEIYEKSHSFL